MYWLDGPLRNNLWARSTVHRTTLQRSSFTVVNIYDGHSSKKSVYFCSWQWRNIQSERKRNQHHQYKARRAKDLFAFLPGLLCKKLLCHSETTMQSCLSYKRRSREDAFILLPECYSGVLSSYWHNIIMCW